MTAVHICIYDKCAHMYMYDRPYIYYAFGHIYMIDTLIYIDIFRLILFDNFI